MQQGQKLAYKVPFLSEFTKDSKQSEFQSSKQLTIIGVIDASGSMHQWWSWLATFWNSCIPQTNLITITFSQVPKVCESNQLSTKIQDHGGNSTEIVPAFQLLEKQLDTVPLEQNITVVFISDGQDNNMKTLEARLQSNLKGNTIDRDINFICLGVQSGFPTTLAMNLRALYHRGDPQVPAVYLIEYASEQAFFNKFETMKKYFYAAASVKLNNVVNLFPYDECVTDEAYEGQWVISHNNNIGIVNGETNIPLQGIPLNQVDIEDAIDIFRSWVQNLQIKVMDNKEHSIEQAQQCLEYMNSIVEQLNIKMEMDVINTNLAEMNDFTLPFHQRARLTYVYKYGNKIKFFVDEVTSLAKGVNPKQLSEFEQAKRLQLGTITGKHYQKALALKGITIEEFKKMKEEFQVIIQSCQFKAQNEQGQERSVVSLDNQRDVLQDKQLINEGLKFVKSQYDFAETFPLIGHGIKVRRPEGSQLNPWIVQVVQFAQQNKIIDSGYLIKNSFQVQLQTGGNQKEEINCILPLYNDTDADLQPIIRSRVIKLLLTFMVQQNIDTYYEETYLALLANALGALYNEEQTQWTREAIDLIYSTTKLAYQGTEQFENYLQKLLINPKNAYLEKDQEYETYVAIFKPFLYLFYAVRAGVHLNFEREIERLIIYSIFRGQKSQKLDIEAYYQIKLLEEDEAQLQEIMKQKFKDNLHQNEFRNSLSVQITTTVQQFYLKPTAQISVHDRILYTGITRFNMKILENFYQSVTGKQFDKQRYIHLFYHALTFPEQDVLILEVNYQNLIEIKHAIKKAVVGDFDNSFTQIKDRLLEQYHENFVQIHQLVRPYTYEKLVAECQQHGVNVLDIAYNKNSGLANNCCFAPQCPFYLKVLGKENFTKHMQNWQNMLPVGFHLVVAEKLKTTKDIQAIMAAIVKQWPGLPEKFQSTKAFVENYIQAISECLPPKYDVKLPEGQAVSGYGVRSGGYWRQGRFRYH